MGAENAELVRRALGAYERNDLPAMLAFLHPDVEWIPARAATEGAYHGHAGIRRFVADTRESFDVFEPRMELREAGDRVLAGGTIRVRGATSGVEIDVPVAGVFEFRDGLISRWQDFGSEPALRAAVGLEG